MQSLSHHIVNELAPCYMNRGYVIRYIELTNIYEKLADRGKARSLGKEPNAEDLC